MQLLEDDILKLKSLYIKNFRSIKELSMEFSALTVIVGENNIGKTTILKALYKILKMDESPHRVRFFEDDFYLDKSSNKRNEEIIIELTFDELGEYDKTAFVWSGIDVSSNRLSILLEARWEEENNDANVEISFVRKDDPENSKGESFNLSHKKYMPFYYIDAYRDIKKETNSSSGDLRQIFKDHNKHYLKPLNAQINSCINNVVLYLKQYKDEDPETLDILKEINKNLDLIYNGSTHFTDCLDDFCVKLNTCDQNLKEHISSKSFQNKELIEKIQLGVQNICQKSNIQLIIEELQSRMNNLHGVQEIKRILKDNLTLFVPESQIDIELAKIDESNLFDENNVSLEDVSILKQGSGFQGSFVIALKLSRLLTHLKYSDEKITNLIIAIEEPEAHMHPHLQRSLIKKLQNKQREFSELGYNVQLLITTHSPSILSQIEKSSICLLKRENSKCKVIKLDDVFEQEIVRELGKKDKLKHFDIVFRSYPEIFLSRGVIVVEGHSELGSIPEFAKIMNIDLDELGLLVINAGGKGNAKPMYTIIKKFTNCAAIKDKDHDNSADSLVDDENELFYRTDYADYEEELVNHVDNHKLALILVKIDPENIGKYYLELLRKYVENAESMEVSELISSIDKLDLTTFKEKTLDNIKEELLKTLKKHKSSLMGAMISSHLDENEIPMCYRNIILKAKEMVSQID